MASEFIEAMSREEVEEILNNTEAFLKFIRASDNGRKSLIDLIKRAQDVGISRVKFQEKYKERYHDLLEEASKTNVSQETGHGVTIVDAAKVQKERSLTLIKEILDLTDDDEQSFEDMSRQQVDDIFGDTNRLSEFLRGHGRNALIGLVKRALSLGVSPEDTKERVFEIKHHLEHRADDLAERYKGVLEEISNVNVPEEPGHGVAKQDATALQQKRISEFAQEFPSEADVIKSKFSMDSIPRLLETTVGRSHPELVQMFLPRQYDGIGQYHSPKILALFLANMVKDCIEESYQDLPTAYRLAIPSLKDLTDKRVPTFFVSKEILKAILMTDFPDDIDWTDMKLPFEQGVFMLPRGGYSHEKDGEVSAVLWTRIRAGKECLPVASGIPRVTLGNTSFALLALCPESGIWYDSSFSANKRPTIRLKNLFYRGPDDAMPMMSPGLEENLSEKDANFLEGLGIIVFGLFLAMNAKPELYESGKLLKKSKKGDRTREFWSPNVIGSKYKPKREVPKIVDGKFLFDNHEHGTHASPRMHWRRGHFRQQACGEGYRERKTVWIEPCLVGA